MWPLSSLNNSLSFLRDQTEPGGARLLIWASFRSPPRWYSMFVQGNNLYKKTTQYQLISIHERLHGLFVCPSPPQTKGAYGSEPAIFLWPWAQSLSRARCTESYLNVKYSTVSMSTRPSIHQQDFGKPALWQYLHKHEIRGISQTLQHAESRECRGMGHIIWWLVTWLRWGMGVWSLLLVTVEKKKGNISVHIMIECAGRGCIKGRGICAVFSLTKAAEKRIKGPWDPPSLWRAPIWFRTLC